MTKLKLTVAAFLAATTFAATDAFAQNLRAVGPPSEYPPASYTAKQYVDSQGCVYVRAGVNGAVQWVPRVSRDRKLICGQSPSLGVATASVASAPVVITPQRSVRGVPNRSVQTQKFSKSTTVYQERIVPKHVYDSQGDTIAAIPNGYKPAWKDDRLNPHRAHMTREGYLATQQIMSNTVARRDLSGGQRIKPVVIVGHGKGLGH